MSAADGRRPPNAAVVVSIALDAAGVARLSCSVCGDLGGGLDYRTTASAVRTRIPGHVALHSTALANGVPWEVVEVAREQLEAWQRDTRNR